MFRQGIEYAKVAFDEIIPHTSRLAMMDLHPAVPRQTLQGFPQRGAGDAQGFGQLALGGQMAVGGESAIEDGFDQARFDEFGWFFDGIPGLGIG